MSPEITVPEGLIYWFRDRPIDLGGPCPHSDCPHDDNEVVAWGPTFDLYEMVLCGECGCRGWKSPDGTPDFRITIFF